MDFEFLVPFRIPHFFLKVLGLWPSKKSSQFYSLFGFGLLVFFMGIFTFSHTIYLIQSLKVGTILEISNILNILLTVYGVILKAFWFIVKRQKVKEMIDTLKKLVELTDFEPGRKQITLEKHSTKMLKVIKFYYGSAFLAVTVAILVAVINYKRKLLPYETWITFDYQNNDGAYWILLVHGTLLAVYGSIINYSVDLIPIIFINYIAALLEELSDEISTLVESIENTAEKSLTKLKQCIDCHIKIKTFADEISNHLTFPFFLQTIFSTVILCTSAFMLTMVFKFQIMT